MSQKKRKHQYTEQFKQDAVNHYLNSDKSLESVAADLKISKSSLSKWAQSAQNNEGLVNHRGSGNYKSDAEKENARLRKELRDAKDALEILKKAISILND